MNSKHHKIKSYLNFAYGLCRNIAKYKVSSIYQSDRSVKFHALHLGSAGVEAKRESRGIWVANYSTITNNYLVCNLFQYLVRCTINQLNSRGFREHDIIFVIEKFKTLWFFILSTAQNLTILILFTFLRYSSYL